VHAGTYPGFDIGKYGIAPIGEGSPSISGAVGLNKWNRFISCNKKILTPEGLDAE
jgi:hypothetical protein